MTTQVPIVVMASGQGTNFEAIARAIELGQLSAEIRAVVSDQPQAPVLDKARARGLRAISVPFPESGASLAERRLRHEERLLAEIEPLRARFVVMAGYRRIVTSRLLSAFRSERGYSRVVNVHPSLLPAFPGLEAFSQAFRYGASVAGVTIHLVDEQLDGGPILAQEAFSLAGCSSVADVARLGHELEHRLYPRTLAWVLPERFEVVSRERRLCVCPL